MAGRDCDPDPENLPQPGDWMFGVAIGVLLLLGGLVYYLSQRH